MLRRKLITESAVVTPSAIDMDRIVPMAAGMARMITHGPRSRRSVCRSAAGVPAGEAARGWGRLPGSDPVLALRAVPSTTPRSAMACEDARRPNA